MHYILCIIYYVLYIIYYVLYIISNILHTYIHIYIYILIIFFTSEDHENMSQLHSPMRQGWLGTKLQGWIVPGPLDADLVSGADTWWRAVGCGLIVGFKTLIKVRYFEIILPYFTHGKHCRSVTPAIRCKIIAICRIYTHVKPANQFRTGCRISLWIPFKQAEQSMTLCIFS